jgi:excisionase family DNA binding protein
MTVWLYTPDEVAAALSVSRFTVIRWLRVGTLRGLKVGSQWRIERATFEDLVNGKIEFPQSRRRRRIASEVNDG